MALIMNASTQEHTVKIHGAWFTFKPKQIKLMDEDKSFFLSSKRSYLGFVNLPDSLEDLDFRASPEGKKLLEENEARGVAARVSFLEAHVRNEQHSLRKDMDGKNNKAGTSSEIGDDGIAKLAEIATELKGYKKAARGAEIEQEEKLKKIFKDLEA